MNRGSRWKHYRGTVYTLVALCRLEKTLEPCVIYTRYEPENERGIAPHFYGEYWCRPLAEWNEEVAPGVKRFTAEPVEVG